MAPPHNAARWGPIRSLLYLSPFFFVIPWFALHELYDLPEPITDLTGLPQISETQILAYVRHLSEDIGFRTVGTAEHALADKWMIDTAHEVQRECQQIVQADPERKLECEVWHQRGSGAHRFDMMGKRLYKTYTDLTNIVIRVSNGTSEGKEHAVLVNAHVDSTLPSPGAADDALSVGVMLECIRVLTHTPGWTPAYAIVFLFNHAEESLQDASHLFSTQHPIAHTIRAFINLEAAGNKGAELLFQVNSEEMIRAYSKMAVVGNSYVYHTRQDSVDNIQPGVAQRMAENTLAILQYLSSDESPLPSLTTGYSRPATVFFTQFGRFFQFQFATARLMYGTLFALSLTLARFAHQKRAPGSSSTIFLTEQWKGARALLFALCGALIGANGLAAMMHRALGRNMSWFASEHSALLLYGPATFGGILASQVVFPEVAERSVLTALLLMQSGGALLLQLLGLGSSYLLFFGALPLFVALSLDTLLNHGPVVSLWTYALSLVVPLLTGMQMTCVVLDVFVPLTGRIGADAQAEHVIASIAAVMLSITVPLVTPFSHRFSENVRMNAVTVLNIVTVVAVAIFALRSPFDDTHQRRVFLLGSDNITSHERYLHVSAADGAPGFEQLVHDIAANFGVVGTQAVQEDMHDWNGDWDILYPFSALPIEPGFVSPFAAGERAFKITHPGLIWTVLAFDAHVLQWTLDDAPPNEFTRHHIKGASFYNVDRWSVDLVLEGTSPLMINFLAIDEAAMWPGKKAATEAKGGHAMMTLFESVDNWLARETRDSVDVMLLATVGGVVTV
ncbi:hypothetical protein EDB84DRAFT_1512163 [Lactarius hengduanensis]|nr:hypothetical protein EDB84DRAFT_1512163 [Lactarius hengduanensis]